MKFSSVLLFVVLILTAIVSIAGAEAVSPATAVHLRVEYLDAPLGISVQKPRLFCQMKDDRRGAAQTAYQILVSDDLSLLAKGQGNVWDSGRVASSDSIQIVFEGKPLKPHTFYYWKVRIWDAQGKPTAYSAPARFSTGVFDAKDMKGQWIGPDRPLVHPELKDNSVPKEATHLKGCSWVWYDDPARKGNQMPSGNRYFRKVFELPESEKPSQAFLLFVGDDAADVFVNGQRVFSARYKAPCVRREEVTWAIKPGKNVIAATGANYIEGSSAGICGKLVMCYPSGKTIVIPVDETWRVSNRKVPHYRDIETNESRFQPVVKLKEVDEKLRVVEEPNYGVAQLRKEFDAKGKVKRAMVHASALGNYKLHINGQPVGEDYFTPGWTDYHKRVYYNTYDVTDLIRSEGPNAIGAELAAGWYAGTILVKRNHYGELCRLLVQLELEMEDGSRRTIVTDPTWKMKYGPRLESEFLAGETYDARLQTPGWSQPGFEDAGWKAVVVDPPTDRKLSGYPAQPVRITGTLKPVAITEPKPGTFVFDLGQNFAGFARLKVKGPAGTKVRLRFAEMLDANGMVYTTNLRHARCEDTYILKGDPAGETWQPQFTYHGFRYVEMTGYPGRPTEEAITGVAINSDTPMTGTFTCSSPMVNRLYQNVLWTQRANYMEVPTDCPQRNERLGWAGDAQGFSFAAALNADVSAFFTKWLVDLEDAQRPHGGYADVAPNPMRGGSSNAGWADAGVICPMAIHNVYGDTRILARHYDSMVKFVEYLKKCSKNGIRPGGAYGDWLSIKADTPKEVMATAYAARSVQLVARAAEILGKKEDAQKFRKLADEFKAAFNREFVDKDGRIRGNTQAAYVWALAFELLSPEHQKLATKYLLEDIRSRGNHLSTGIQGTAYLMPTLTKIGAYDTAYTLLLSETFPSWGYTIKHGATSIWERWDGWTEDKGFQNPIMNSFSHYVLGAVSRWMFETAGGIHPSAPGYREIRLAPKLDKRITWANADYDSIQGRISSHWKKSADGRFQWHVTVPANTTATLVIPTTNVDSVTEGGQPLANVPGVKVLGTDAEGVKLHVPAGTYTFAAVL